MPSPVNLFPILDSDKVLTDIQYTGYTSLNVSYTYDNYNRKTGMADGTGSHTYTYDYWNNLNSVSTTYTGLSAQTISYTYYSDGSRNTIAIPGWVNNGVTLIYSYDGAGRLTTLEDPASRNNSWEYESSSARNLITKQTLANTSYTEYTYNNRGQLVQLYNKKSDGTVWSSFTGSSGGAGAYHMSYDAAGNRTEFIAGTLYAGTTDYTYDTKNELTQESSTRTPGYTYSNVYDSAENPTTFRGTASLTYNGKNQKTNTGYTFDNNGNPTTYNSTTLTFDVENRMTAYGTALTAGYRGDDLRAWRQTGASGTRIYYLYDGTYPVCELDSTGTPIKINVYGANGLLERRDLSGNTDVFYMFDPQGSVVHRRDGSQTVLTDHLYDAWGNLLSATANPDPFGYIGQAGYYTDTATGMILCTFRYYDPANGRFLNRDPNGFDGGINLYAYVRNKPIRYSDPLGLSLKIPYVSNCICDALKKAYDMHKRNDKLAHCYAHCRAIRCTGGGPISLIGIPWYNGRHESDPWDRRANWLGAKCAVDQAMWPLNKYPDCYTCCKDAVKGLPNDPGDIGPPTY